MDLKSGKLSLELVRKTKIVRLYNNERFDWFKKALKRLYDATKITLGITFKLIQDLRNGGKQLLLSLKKEKALHISKYYLYGGINFAGL